MTQRVTSKGEGAARTGKVRGQGLALGGLMTLGLLAFAGGAWAQAVPRSDLPASRTTAALNADHRADHWQDDWDAQRRDREITSRLNADTTYSARVETGIGPRYAPERALVPMETAGSPWVATSRQVWRESDGHTDSLRLDSAGVLRRADGSPLPPGAGDAVVVDDERYGLSYRRGWPSTLGYTASGLEVTLTPHAGFGLTPDGPMAEAGAMLAVGSDFSRLVPEGQQVFGDRARWYVYAAGSGRAVGYNFARNRDGDYARSGYSHDSGAFLGDASLGLAYRRGDMHSSIGFIYREIEPGGMRSVRNGVDTDVSEGMLAFQFSIKPDW